MSKIKIDENIVKDVLRNRKNKINSIHRKMNYLTSDIDLKNEILTSICLRSQRLSDLPKARGRKKDMSDVYEAYQKSFEEQKYEIQEQFWKLVEQEDMIERVWQCFLALEEPYFSILEAIYVKQEKYEVVLEESGLSNQPFNEKRRHGIEAIIMLYNSDFSMHQLEAAGLQRTSYKKLRKKKSKDSMEENQVTIFMNIEDLTEE